MRVLINPVIVFYSFLFLLIILLPVNSGFLIKLIACCFLILLSFPYLLGRNYTLIRNRFYYNSDMGKPLSLKTMLLFIFIQFCLAIYAGGFYTGLGLVEAFQNTFSGASNYSIYQAYFNNEKLYSFSINKFPAIIAYFYVKFIFIFSLYFYLIRKNERIDSLIVYLSVIPVIILAVYRGTSFELFEILVAIICAFYIKSKLGDGHRFPAYRVLFLAVFLFIIYIIQIMFRYKFEYVINCRNEFCYDYESFIHQVAPSLASVLYKLSGYFYFAPDYMARWFIYFFENESLLNLFLPGNGVLFDYEGRWLCGKEFACGPTWAPDFEVFTYILGLPLMIFIIMVLSTFQNYLEKAAAINFIDFFGYYLITLQFFAFPVGNFLFVSSANQLMVILFIALFALRFFSKNSRILF